jgi:hypothetical protein
MSRVRWIGVLTALMLAACGGGGGGGGGGGSGNQAPVFTSSPSVSVYETTTQVFYTAIAVDPEALPVTYSIAAGDDGALFTINASTGELAFLAPADFEVPRDADSDNLYSVTLRASDGATFGSLTLTVMVNDAIDTSVVRRVATGFTQPLYLSPLDSRGPQGRRRVLVLEKAGLARILRPFNGVIETTPFLDLTAEISTQGEGGLLGVALAPDYDVSGVFYVFVTSAFDVIQIRRYRTRTGNPSEADPTSASVILSIPHPGHDNHYGGWIGFGPDDNLYIATGDGGGAGDPAGNAQNTNSLLGKILRIDPSGDDFPADDERNYAIPADNPFLSGGGAPEVWVYGLRNPFRASFDLRTGHLFVGDVGQGAREEINLIRQTDGGRNYGWNRYEGTSIAMAGSPPFPGSTAPPILEYAHGDGDYEGGTVIGGYVYDGSWSPAEGVYYFADFVNPRIWSMRIDQAVPELVVPGITITNGDPSGPLQSGLYSHPTSINPPYPGAYTAIASFGIDHPQGNIYIVDFGDGEIFQIVGGAN